MVVCVKFSAPPPAGLTKEQVWAGLLIKATEGAALVPMIAETEIISKRKDGVTRKTTLKDGKVLHKITTLRKSRLSMEYNAEESGIKTFNSISEGKEGLFYTLMQLVKFEGVEEEEDEEEEMAAPFSAHGPDAVAATIQRLEELASEGKLS